MQSLKYREILHAVAYKLGYDPLDPNFPRDEAVAIGTYIDQWVTRLYPARDWPEWTKIRVFVPDANHIVPYTPSAAFGHVGEPLPKIWHPLAVYIVDPSIVVGCNSTKFYLREEGIHCGHDHGTSVWIKYLEPPPRFTSVEWDPTIRYAKDDVVYSFATGDVYKSKTSGNLNHDPAVGFSLNTGNQPTIGGTTLVQTDIVQNKAISQFGAAAQDKIMKVYVGRIAGSGTTTIPDPPAATSLFSVNVLDSAGTILATSSSVGDGVVGLSDITTDLATQLSGILGGGWTVTPDTTGFFITVENASDFNFVSPVTGTDWPSYYANTGSYAQPLLYTVIQPYVAAVTNATITPQIIKTTYSAEQLIAGATYSFEFKDLGGVDHLFEYESVFGDGQDQIISGIMSSLSNANVSDNYFSTVIGAADPATPSLTFTISDHASLNATITLPGSPWWEVVPFPLALAEQVIRGAFADALKDWGQTDKATVEEQAVAQESDTAAQKFSYAPTLPLTGQANPRSRYKQ